METRRRWWVVVLLAALLVSLPAVPAGAAEKKETLVLLNWAEYMPPELLRDFEKRYGVTVKEVYYETEEALDQMLAYTRGTGYDLVIGSRIKALGYIGHKWLAPVSTGQVPNMKNLDPRWAREYPVVTGYAVPYLWGTVGIAYRKSLVKEKVDSWMQLFKPSEALRGRIMMIEDVRDSVGMALKALGYSLNSRDPGELARAEKLLLAQKPFVKRYGYLSLSGNSDLLTGRYWMAMLYNGDALTLMDKSDDVRFVTPREGTNIWLDCIMVLASSKKKEAAFRFINFLNEPENAARLAEYLYMASPNRAAKQFLSKEHLADPDIYPPPEVILKSESYEPLPPRIMKRYNAVFTKASYGLL